MREMCFFKAATVQVAVSVVSSAARESQLMFAEAFGSFRTASKISRSASAVKKSVMSA